jgi:shikimate dehydrogenase
MYNWFFAARGYRASYEAMDIPGGLEEALPALRGLRGFNVTTPFKVAILGLLDDVAGAARTIGAVNTVSVEGGRMVGYNTDYKGFLYALKTSGTAGYDTVLLIGAGGAARAALYALRGLARRVYIVSRTGHTARELAGVALSWGFDYSLGARQGENVVKRAVSRADLVVNASPVGSDGVSVPVSVEGLEEPCTVVDMVYRPLETPLLRAARRAGCRTVDGLWMLAAQAAENLRIWLGEDASPVDLRRAAMGAQ